MFDNYKIEILPIPQIVGNKKLYFWVIYGFKNNTWGNITCGWMDSPESAFNKALNKYYELIT